MTIQLNAFPLCLTKILIRTAEMSEYLHLCLVYQEVSVQEMSYYLVPPTKPPGRKTVWFS